MASERILACAYYLVDNAAPNVAEVIRRLRQESRQNWQSFLDEAFESSRESLCPRRIQAILGQAGDDWTREAYVSAVKLHNEALATAVKDRAVWDRRRTARTRRRLLASLADDHILRWMKDRGMDPLEAARLRDKGGRNDNPPGCLGDAPSPG